MRLYLFKHPNFCFKIINLFKYIFLRWMYFSNKILIGYTLVEFEHSFVRVSYSFYCVLLYQYYSRRKGGTGSQFFRIFSAFYFVPNCRKTVFLDWSLLSCHARYGHAVTPLLKRKTHPPPLWTDAKRHRGEIIFRRRIQQCFWILSKF